MQLGIRNGVGDLYRMVGVAGGNAWLEAINTMRELGFVDELAGGHHSKQGCDAIVSRKA
ncbi:hypothetical protein [Cupriavidus necator]